MKQEGEEKYCNISKSIFIKHFENNYNFIKEKLPLLENLDPDGIHDIRVTSRRNRALFLEFNPFLSREIKKEYILENKKITKLLGKRRELDVLYKLLISIRTENPEIISENLLDSFSNYLKKKRKEEEENCRIAQNVLEKRIKKISEEPYIHISTKICIFKYSKKRIFTAIRDIQNEYKRVKKISDPLNEELHQFRILLKKTRYMFEIYREVYESPINKWLNILKEIQGYLGDWNDYRILLIKIKDKCRKDININHSEILRINKYIHGILNNKLEQMKLMMKRYRTNRFIELTIKDILKIFYSHICIV